MTHKSTANFARHIPTPPGSMCAAHDAQACAYALRIHPTFRPITALRFWRRLTARRGLWQERRGRHNGGEGGEGGESVECSVCGEVDSDCDWWHRVVCAYMTCVWRHAW